MEEDARRIHQSDRIVAQFRRRLFEASSQRCDRILATRCERDALEAELAPGEDREVEKIFAYIDSYDWPACADAEAGGLPW